MCRDQTAEHEVPSGVVLVAWTTAGAVHLGRGRLVLDAKVELTGCGGLSGARVRTRHRRRLLGLGSTWRTEEQLAEMGRLEVGDWPTHRAWLSLGLLSVTPVTTERGEWTLVSGQLFGLERCVWKSPAFR